MIAAALLIGLAANTDNLSIGISYGIQGRHIALIQNVLVAVGTTAATLAALLAGQELHRGLLSAVPNRAGGIILILLAVIGLVRSARRKPEAVRAAGVGWVEVALLAASLSVNNLGLAFAGGLAGVPHAVVLAAVFCFSIALLSAGQFAGERAGRRLVHALGQAWIGNIALLLAGAMILLGK